MIATIGSGPDGGIDEAKWYADSLPLKQPHAMVASHQPEPSSISEYRFKQRYIPIGVDSAPLRLYDDSIVRVDSRTMTCEVVGWGVGAKVSDASSLPRLMGRRFLELFSKADQGTLTPSEREAWLGLTERVDFAAFSNQRSAPQYLEGRIQSVRPLRVTWQDGDPEKLAGQPEQALSILQKDDYFAGFVKYDRDGRVIHIERLLLLDPDELP